MWFLLRRQVEPEKGLQPQSVKGNKAKIVLNFLLGVILHKETWLVMVLFVAEKNQGFCLTSLYFP